jgi:Sec-independent protein secretion pathway component TatC
MIVRDFMDRGTDRAASQTGASSLFKVSVVVSAHCLRFCGWNFGYYVKMTYCGRFFLKISSQIGKINKIKRESPL